MKNVKVIHGAGSTNYPIYHLTPFARTFDFSDHIQVLMDIDEKIINMTKELERVRTQREEVKGNLPKQIVELYEAEEIINKLKGE